MKKGMQLVFGKEADMYHMKADETFEVDITRPVAFQVSIFYLFSCWMVHFLIGRDANIISRKQYKTPKIWTNTTKNHHINITSLPYQVGHLGKRYDAWVHDSLPGAPVFFNNKYLEASTKVGTRSRCPPSIPQPLAPPLFLHKGFATPLGEGFLVNNWMCRTPHKTLQNHPYHATTDALETRLAN